jgi:hypothetical protein
MSGAWHVPATSLNPLLAASREPQLQRLLQELERACYGGGHWTGLTLAQALRELPARGESAPPGRDTLPPLYP